MTQRQHLRPALGRVVIQPMLDEAITQAGIILVSGTTTGDNHVGTIIAVSEQYRAADDDEDALAPVGPLYHVGDRVIYGKWTGCDVTLRQTDAAGLSVREKYLIMRESEILATLEDDRD